MSSIIVDSLQFANQRVGIFIGSVILVGGLLGSILNIIILTSLKTFRETTCAFYLTIASIVDIVQLLSVVLPRYLTATSQTGITSSTQFLCKSRFYISINCAIIWLTCLCFAAIDQFFSLTDHWHRFSNIRVARRSVFVAIVFWCIFDIPIALFSDVSISPITNQSSCTIRNPIFTVFYSQFLIPVVHGFLPITIRVTFGLLSFHRVRRLTNRQVPIVRSRRDRQLTAMVLIEVVVDFLLMVPFIIFCIYDYNTVVVDAISSALNQLIFNTTLLLFYSSGAASFYIYCCSSSRFRRQLMHVLINIHLKRCQQRANKLHNNRVVSQSTYYQGVLSIVGNTESQGT